MFAAGSGPPLIVIPGVQGRWEWLRPALERLASRCYVLSYSLCGDFGADRNLDPALGFENYIRQLDDVAGDRSRIAICGVSYGGVIALRYAARRPDRVAALILASAPAPGWAPTAVQGARIRHPWRSTPGFIVTAPSRMWPEIHAAFDTTAERVSFALRYGLRLATAPMIPSLMAARIVEQQSMDLRPDCAAVVSPTLVVSGEPHLDAVVPVESTRKYLDMIPGSKYVMIERTGHIGLVTRPDRWTGVVADFVTEHANGF